VELALLPESASGAAAGTDTVFGAGGEPRLRARISGAWDVAELTVDGAPVPLVRRGEIVEATPPPLPPGRMS